MVICDGATMATTIASIMMNGVCCAYNFEDEERRKAEQREYLRKSVKVEWQRQRIVEKEQEMEEQRRQEDAQFLAEQRRRLLMETKRRAVGGAESSVSDEEHYMQRWQRIEGVHYTSGQIDGRVQSAPVVGARRTMTRHHPAHHNRQHVVRCPSNTSSLMDQDTDSDDDFEDIKLT